MKLNRSIAFTHFFGLICCSMIYGQSPIGNAIIGDYSKDQLGRSVSMPDAKTVAVGAPYSSDMAVRSGYIKVYSWQQNQWKQKGLTLNAVQSARYFGLSVYMADSNTLAASYSKYGFGYVSIFSWSGEEWKQKGQILESDVKYGRFGTALSMPNANCIAIGAPYNHRDSVGKGYVEVYTWDDNKWQLRGDRLTGKEVDDEFGAAISMPSCDVLAIGSPQSDEYDEDAGKVDIFEWKNQKWTAKGYKILGKSAGGEFGSSIGMPSENTLAVGAPSNNHLAKSGGEVVIYNWLSNEWRQRGQKLLSENKWALFGYSVSMPNENTLAVGEPDSDSHLGKVLVYKWGLDKWYQYGEEMIGQQYGDEFGYAIHMPNEYTLAVGAPYFNGSTNGSFIGQLRVFGFCRPISTTVKISTCETNYTSPTGNTYFSTGLYYDTLQTVMQQCDSILKIRLTLLPETKSFLQFSACRSFDPPSGRKVFTQSGTYFDTIANANGCDSVMTINLTITPNVRIRKTHNALEASAENAEYQWLSCDEGYSPVPNATNKQFFLPDYASYAVAVTQNGCTDTSKCLSLRSTNVDDAAQNQNMHVYPNPTSGRLFLVLPNDENPARLTISAMDGKIYESPLATDGSFMLPNVPGFYIINVIMPNGQSRRVKILKY